MGAKVVALVVGNGFVCYFAGSYVEFVAQPAHLHQK